MLSRPLVPADGASLRANNFDALRLALALMVLWSHCFAIWYGTEAGEPLSLLLGGIKNAGSVAVLGFFAISGFLITLSCLRARSAWSFLDRRLRRIMPAYLVATTICALVVVPSFSTRPFWPIPADVLRGLASNLLLRNYIPASDAFDGGPVNGALWSIPYEAWCYLGVLALGLLGLAGRGWVFAVGAVVVMLGRAWLDLTGRKTGGGTGLLGMLQIVFGFPYFWFVVLPPFLLGAALLHYRRWVPRSPLLLVGSLLALIVAAHLPTGALWRKVATDAVLPVTLVYLVFFIAFSPGLRLHRAARFGDFSYGTYLYAFPIQQMLRWSLHGRVGFATYLLLCVVASLAAAVASWWLVERWFVRPPPRRGPRLPLSAEAAIVAP